MKFNLCFICVAYYASTRFVCSADLVIVNGSKLLHEQIDVQEYYLPQKLSTVTIHNSDPVIST